MDNLKIFLIENFDQLKEIKKEWLDLEEKINHQHLTNSYNWLENWWRIFAHRNDNVFGFNKELKIIILLKDNSVHAIFPFVRLYRSFFGFKLSFLEFLAQQWGGQSIDLVAKDFEDAGIGLIFSWIRSNIKYDFMILKYLPESTALKKHFTMRAYSGCPTIAIHQYKNYDEYVNKNYSKKLRQNLRTARNKARKNSQALSENIESINSENISEMVRLSEQKVKDGKVFMYADNEKLQYYKLVYSKFDSSVIFVKINGQKVCFRSNITVRGKKYCVDSSYDRAYRPNDLGALSVDMNIRDSFEKKIKIHSMGPGLDWYKLKFTKNVEKLYMIGAIGNSFKSKLLNPLFQFSIQCRANKFNTEMNRVLR